MYVNVDNACGMKWTENDVRFPNINCVNCSAYKIKVCRHLWVVRNYLQIVLMTCGIVFLIFGLSYKLITCQSSNLERDIRNLLFFSMKLFLFSLQKMNFASTHKFTVFFFHSWIHLRLTISKIIFIIFSVNEKEQQKIFISWIIINLDLNLMRAYKLFALKKKRWIE